MRLFEASLARLLGDLRPLKSFWAGDYGATGCLFIIMTDVVVLLAE
jgi:hypothetical protein